MEISGRQGAFYLLLIPPSPPLCNPLRASLSYCHAKTLIFFRSSLSVLVLREVREKVRDVPSRRIVTASQRIEDELDIREDRGKTLRPRFEYRGG